MHRLRICIVGNSHIGALKLAWEEDAARYPDVDITFFGSHGYRLKDLGIRGRSLVPADDELREMFSWTSGGCTAIDVDDYDVFFVHGLLSLPRILRCLWRQGCFSPQDGSWQQALKNTAQADVVARLQRTPAVGFLQDSLIAFGKPVILSPTPFLSEEAISQQDPFDGDIWRALLGEDGAPVPPVALVLEAWANYLSAAGHLKQPASTVTHELFSQARFSRGSLELTPALDTQHDATDYSHMNRDYGREVLAAMVPLARERAARIPAHADLPQEPAVADSRVHPYTNLPPESHWMRAVADRDGSAVSGIYRKKFELSDARIATAGSCFAQHIGRMLRHGGFRYLDLEPAPAGLPAEQQAARGYGMYSARYGNVYTSRQLLQLFDRAFGGFEPAENYWTRDGGIVDALRPTIETEPFGSVAEMRSARREHLAAVQEMFCSCDVFVYTLGLTEAWESTIDGTVYPVAPGVSGGAYDPALHRMVNLGFNDVVNDLRSFMAKAREVSPRMRFLLTVSPVPLMATATGEHVLVATTRSKSVLRAAAAHFAENRAIVDYFPSFELINSHVMAGRYYESDKRQVSDDGVAHVMRHFFAEHRPPRALAGDAADDDVLNDDVACDEALLAAFGRRPESGG